jgi:hypothetical protein
VFHKPQAQACQTLAVIAATFRQTKNYMKKTLFLLINIITAGQLLAQELLLDNGLYYEKPNHSDDSFDKYSKDNISYKSNTAFIYDYYYIDKLGAKRKFIKADNYTEDNPLNLTSYQNIGDSGIDKIKITVNDRLGLKFRTDSSYTQTFISFDYLDKMGNTQNAFNGVGEEITGVIDNKKNLWIHPPRSYTFKILEFNPFPFYYIDETVKRWTWKLDVGGPHYLDSRWIDAKETVHISYLYTRAKDETLKTPLGEIVCKVTIGTASSESNNKLMKTHLKSYYNSNYGFVKLVYDNINGSQLVMDLIDIKKQTVKSVSKADIISKYQQTCCLEYFSENLFLKSDSTFKYTYEDKSHKELHDGRWKQIKDTLVLYDYRTDPSTFKTLDGEETVVSELHDSISISFQNPKTKELVLPKIFINGKCLKAWPNVGSTYFILKQNIKSISVKDGIYHVKNNKANKFIIYYEPNWAGSAEFRVTNISKCIIKDNSIIRLDCDGSIDNSYKLNKK